jgi:hypothetical protein
MDWNANRDDSDTGQPDAYWRRRVITLCAGLALLGLLAWAFSGGGKQASTAQKGTQANGVLPAAAYSGPATSSPAGAGTSASAAPAASLPFPTVTSSAGTSQPGNGQPGNGQPGTSQPGTSQPGNGPSASGKSAASAAAAGAGAGNVPAGTVGGVEPGGGCAPDAVVLSLFTSRTYYYAGQHPSFGVYAVSTASRACSFDVSPARLHVLVMSSGRVIWDSADCTRGKPNRVAELRRGVPAQQSFSWNRIISLPGCVTLASSARPGTYQVQARDATVASPVRTFRLAG